MRESPTPCDSVGLTAEISLEWSEHRKIQRLEQMQRVGWYNKEPYVVTYVVSDEIACYMAIVTVVEEHSWLTPYLLSSIWLKATRRRVCCWSTLDWSR